MRKRDIAPVVRISGYIPDLTKKRPVPDDDVIHICKTRIRAVPNEEMDRANRPLRSLTLGGRIEFDSPVIDERSLRRNQRGEEKRILTEEEFLDQIYESVDGIHPIIMENGRHVIKPIIKKPGEQITAICCDGDSLIRVIDQESEFAFAARALEDELGNMPCISSPKKLSNHGKWRWKQQ